MKAAIMKVSAKQSLTVFPAVIAALLTQLPAAEETSAPAAPFIREVAKPLGGHPGNVFLAGERVSISLPAPLPESVVRWQLLDDKQKPVRAGVVSKEVRELRKMVSLGLLDPGWYRLEFGNSNQPAQAWTTLAVLRAMHVPTPIDSPVAVDSAAAWFAKDDPAQQKRLANLAALAGVNWVRDRLRWAEIQPQPGALKRPPTTYDTSADAHHEAGLQLLQVFHDTPGWAREDPDAGAKFAPDLRHVYGLARELAVHFCGRVAAWEPWNEANVATFGAHTVDQMCSWQKAAWLGFKAGDPKVTVCWNVTTTVPTPAHTAGVLANETWPYYDTYNIHTYEWPHAYAQLWPPALKAAAGRPLWVTEADRGTPHLKNPPWYDQEPRLEKLKAEWIAQSYASSLFSGVERHFHFILGNYQEGNNIQFGLLRHDLTPRPAYVALAAVGRCLAGARPLGRWQPAADVWVYAFRAQPDGNEHDVLVAWAEKEVDWDRRGSTTADWRLPAELKVQEVVDYLGRSVSRILPAPLSSAPLFIFLPAGQAARLPLEAPLSPAPRLQGEASPLVLQLMLPSAAMRKMVDIPWSEGYAYQATVGQPLEFNLNVYNFGTNTTSAHLRVERQPSDWHTELETQDVFVTAMGRQELRGSVSISKQAVTKDDWVAVRADCGPQGRPVVAFRVVVGQ